MWSSWFDDAKKRAADALQATSVAVTKVKCDMAGLII